MKPTYEELEAQVKQLEADNEKAMSVLKEANDAVLLAKSKFEALAAENAELKEALEYVINPDNQPEYHDQGMECGVEDHGYQRDGYSACAYGWESAMERVYSEVIPDAIPETPATSAFLAEVRASAKADGVQEYADSFRHAASKHRELHGKTIRVKALLHEAENADKFSAQLRKGAAQ